MTVTTIYADENDGYIRSGGATGNPTYSTVRSGNNLFTNPTTSELYIGQNKSGSNYQAFQAFVLFDLSGIGAGQEASAVTLSIDGVADLSTTDFIIEAHQQAFGTVSNADWQDGDAYNALTPLATWNSSGYSSSYNDFTSDASFISALDLTGSIELILISAEQVDNSTPTASEYCRFSSANVFGTSSDPKLVVTHAAAASSTKTSRLALLGVN